MIPMYKAERIKDKSEIIDFGFLPEFQGKCNLIIGNSGFTEIDKETLEISFNSGASWNSIEKIEFIISQYEVSNFRRNLKC